MPQSSSEDPVNLLSNFYLLGNYSSVNAKLVDLIGLAWNGYFNTFIMSKDVGYYASYNKYIYDGMLMMNFIVKSHLSKMPAGENGTNIQTDKVIETLNKMVNTIGEKKLYKIKEALIANHWKNETSLEER